MSPAAKPAATGDRKKSVVAHLAALISEQQEAHKRDEGPSQESGEDGPPVDWSHLFGSHAFASAYVLAPRARWTARASVQVIGLL